MPAVPVEVDHSPATAAKPIRVFLDDAEQSGVVIADVEQGYVTKYEMGDDGKYFVRDGRVARETKRGTVRIEEIPSVAAPRIAARRAKQR